MKCARCHHEARGEVEIADVHYLLCNACAKAVEKTAETTVRQLASLFRTQRGVNRLWERA